MKIRVPNLLVGPAWLALSILIFQPSTAFTQGTAFTYQGRLQSNGNPANGNYDLTFTLFNVSSGGSAGAGPLTNSATSVSNGLFVVTLDFGGVFNGTNYWLEIGVRTNGNGAFTTLASRQAMTPTPYAIFAEGASNVVGVVPSGGLSGSYSSVVTLNNPANSFNGSYAGNGGGLTNVNAATLNGLGAAGFWQTTGNAGTIPGANFVGTTDNHPLELHVNGMRGWQLAPTVDSPNVIGGANVNLVAAGVQGATIGGGGSIATYGQPYPNSVSAFHGTIGGGLGNAIQSAAIESTIAGGNQNTIEYNAHDSIIGGGYLNSIQTNAAYATIGGGELNYASNLCATVSGGAGNTASGQGAFVGGGGTDGSGFVSGNTASGGASTVAGGFGNNATNTYATVAGGYGNQATGTGSFIGGGGYDGINYGGNIASGAGATIAGGVGNSATMNDSTVSGGYGNQASGPGSFVGGGGFSNFGISGNTASGTASAVAGGYGNQAGGAYATVSGGAYNQATGPGSFIGGGGTDGVGFGGNTANGAGSTVGGGYGNQANGPGSFVGGGGYDGTSYHANAANGLASTVAGGLGNTTAGDYSTTGGGYENNNLGFYATIGGGYGNYCNGTLFGGATIGGGIFNTNNYDLGTIGGGNYNVVNNLYATVPGGYKNTANGESSFVAGEQSTAGGEASIALGERNNAGANYSFAAGEYATANDNNSFVWSDGTRAAVSQGSNSFAVLATGGVFFYTTPSSVNVEVDNSADLDFGTSTRQMLNLYSSTYGIGVQSNDEYFRTADEFFWFVGGTHNNGNGNAGGGTQLMELDNNGNLSTKGTITANSVLLTSDRNAKEHFTPVDSRVVLAKVASLPVTEWNYKTDQQGVQHIGPMAQDFQAAFGMNGGDDKHISVVDEGGVALAAIQGLNQKVEEQRNQLEQKQTEITELRHRNDSLAARLNKLEAAVNALAKRN